MAVILVVDDDPDIRNLLTETLALEGHTPQTAASGPEALDRVQRQPFDPSATLRADLALVTGSTRRIVNGSLPPAIAGLFDAIVTGGQVQRGKPDPEPYRLAAGRLGLSPSEGLAVEKAPPGIRSARAAGMACVALATTLPAAQLSAGVRQRQGPARLAARRSLKNP